MTLYLINESAINRKSIVESVENYCVRICGEYGLKYTDRVRQNFTESSIIKKNIKQIDENILPKLENDTQEKIKAYLSSRQSPK